MRMRIAINNNNVQSTSKKESRNLLPAGRLEKLYEEQIKLIILKMWKVECRGRLQVR